MSVTSYSTQVLKKLTHKTIQFTRIYYVNLTASMILLPSLLLTRDSSALLKNTKVPLLWGVSSLGTIGAIKTSDAFYCIAASSGYTCFTVTFHTNPLLAMLENKYLIKFSKEAF